MGLPFKKLSVPPAICLWQRETLPLFTAGCFLGSCLALVVLAGKPSLGFRFHPFQGHSLAAEISLWHFCCCLWEPGQPFCASSSLPTSLIVVKWFLLSVHGYKASLQLVFFWLFQMTSLQFSCNSRLVLGEG